MRWSFTFSCTIDPQAYATICVASKNVGLANSGPPGNKKKKVSLVERERKMTVEMKYNGEKFGFLILPLIKC